MTKFRPNLGSVRSVTRELCRIRQANICSEGSLSWEIGSGIGFWTLLTVDTSRHFPLVGVTLPTVMSIASDALRRAGLVAGDEIDWCCQPAFSISLEHSMQLAAVPAHLALPDFELLYGDADLEADALASIVEAILESERVFRRFASLADWINWAAANLPSHPVQQYAIPVGYCLLGQAEIAQAFVEARLAQLDREHHLAFAKLYAVFFEQVRSALT